MIYGYARVSTQEQNLERQLQALKARGIEDRNIITDKASGKNFDRTGYNLLVGSEHNAALLREGDTLIITALDRLGRNYTEIKEQWQYLTKQLKVDIEVIELPLLNTKSVDNSVDKQFICDLVLQILCYTAEKERENTRNRQRQGIDVMPKNTEGKRYSLKTGRVIGRPVIEYPNNWKNVYNRVQNKEITVTQALRELDLSRTTFYRLFNKYKTNSKI